MAWQIGSTQTVPLVCYKDGVETVPTAPIVTTVNVAGAGFVAATNDATDQGNGAVSVVLENAEVGAWGFVRVVGANGAVGLQAYTAEGDWTVERATNLDAAVSSRAAEATLTAIKGAGWTDETLVSLQATIEELTGDGARTVVFTVSDGSGTLGASLKTQVEDSDGNLVAGPLTTSSLGQVTYYLDDAEGYQFVTPSTAVWQGGSQEFDVAASGAQAITVTAQTLPAPSTADKYAIIINATDEQDTLVGASARTYRVTKIHPAASASSNLVRSSERDAITTDANGQASFELGQDVTSGTLLETWDDADGNEWTRERTFAVDSAAANADDQIYFADIETRCTEAVMS